MSKFFLSLLFFSLFTACQSDVNSEKQVDPLFKKGQQSYQANCIACHHPNPELDGSIAPAVAGSSKELLEARILRAEYPAGYTPKRDSKVMVAMPQLSNDIEALFIFLNKRK